MAVLDITTSRRARRKHKHRKKPMISTKSFRWWHILVAVALGVLGVAAGISMLSRRSSNLEAYYPG